MTTLKEEKEKALMAIYIEGYRKHPETAEELRAAEACTIQSLAEEPWDESSTEGQLKVTFISP